MAWTVWILGDRMSDRDEGNAEHVVALARLLGVALPPEYVAEVARSWRLMAPHRERVTAVELGADAEPAAMFMP
jgi:hypothetical protein